MSMSAADSEEIATKNREILIEKIMCEQDVSYQTAVLLNNYPIIENQQPIQCNLCNIESKPVLAGQGIILKECLHIFCKECVSQRIHSCDTADIPCPFVDDEEERYRVNLTPSEVENLVSKTEYQRHFVYLRLKEAESQISNTFHCRKPNCQGFCILEDYTRVFFSCPVCSTRNHLENNAAENQEQQKSFQNHKEQPKSNSKSSTCNIL